MMHLARNRTTRVLGLAVLGIALALSTPDWTSGQHGGHGQSDRNAENWAPVDKMHLYLCAFHVAKDNPKFQLTAHHFCAPQKGDLHQCVIYDSRGPNPKLLGIEYIIGDDTYKTLSDDEKKYWHPHAYEILSGQLIAPDLAQQGDDIFPGLLLTWGKTWHTWRDPSTSLPLGEPMLMWSANGDGQVNEGLISARDSEFGISTADIRQRRTKYGFKVPQVPAARSLSELGRRWTVSGPDEPTKLEGQ